MTFFFSNGKSFCNIFDFNQQTILVKPANWKWAECQRCFSETKQARLYGRHSAWAGRTEMAPFFHQKPQKKEEFKQSFWSRAFIILACDGLIAGFLQLNDT